MDKIVYDAYSRYFHALEVSGYISYSQVVKLLVLTFYKDFVYNDYRGLISKGDYHLIEQALDCLYGSTCLIPYSNYLKMGKLYLGEISELSQRVQALEDISVLKVIDDAESEGSEVESDIVFVAENPTD